MTTTTESVECWKSKRTLNVMITKNSKCNPFHADFCCIPSLATPQQDSELRQLSLVTHTLHARMHCTGAGLHRDNEEMSTADHIE